MEGLEERVYYGFRDPLTNQDFVVAAQELLTERETVSLPTHGAQFLHYVPLANQ